MSLFGYAPNTKIESAKVNANFTNLSDHSRWVTLQWIFAGTLTTQTSKDYKDLPDDVVFERCDLIVDGVPVGANIIVDIERSVDGGGTWSTIFTGGTNRPVIVDGSRTGATTTIDLPTAVGNSTRYRAKISQVGSTTPGNDLTVTLKGKYALD
jgi:hypothetical protein